MLSFDEILFKSTVHITITSEDTSNVEFVKSFLEPLRDSRKLNKYVINALLYAFANYNDFMQTCDSGLEGLINWDHMTLIKKKYSSLLERFSVLKQKAENALISGKESDLYNIICSLATLSLDSDAVELEKSQHAVSLESSSVSTASTTQNESFALEQYMDQIRELTNKLSILDTLESRIANLERKINSSKPEETEYEVIDDIQIKVNHNSGYTSPFVKGLNKQQSTEEQIIQSRSIDRGSKDSVVTHVQKPDEYHEHKSTYPSSDPIKEIGATPPTDQNNAVKKDDIDNSDNNVVINVSDDFENFGSDDLASAIGSFGITLP